jgi:hypothetical protein
MLSVSSSTIDMHSPLCLLNCLSSEKKAPARLYFGKQVGAII